MSVLPKLPLLAVLITIAADAALPGERSPFRMPDGVTRRTRVKSLHDRTGWVFAKCRDLIDTKTDAEIEALVRQHEEADRAAGSEMR